MIHFVRKLLKINCGASQSEIDQLKAESSRLNSQLQEERVARANATINRDHWKDVAAGYYEQCSCKKRRLAKKCGSCDKYERGIAGE